LKRAFPTYPEGRYEEHDANEEKEGEREGEGKRKKE
jgi:hypothetical protein